MNTKVKVVMFTVMLSTMATVGAAPDVTQPSKTWTPSAPVELQPMLQQKREANTATAKAYQASEKLELQSETTTRPEVEAINTPVHSVAVPKARTANTAKPSSRLDDLSHSPVRLRARLIPADQKSGISRVEFKPPFKGHAYIIEKTRGGAVKLLYPSRLDSPPNFYRTNGTVSIPISPLTTSRDSEFVVLMTKTQRNLKRFGKRGDSLFFDAQLSQFDKWVTAGGPNPNIDTTYALTTITH